MVPNNYWYYEGSNTEPPCDESVSWLVMKEIQHISDAQVASMKSHIGSNARRVQAMNDRDIYQKGVAMVSTAAISLFALLL